MPIDFNRVADFDLSDFGAGVIPEIDGDVVLAPTNAVIDQFMRTLEPDGAPTGMTKVSGASNDGYHAYLLEISGNVRTGGRQTQRPDIPEADSHLFNTPVFSGGIAPSVGSPGVAVPAGPLEAPTVEIVASGISGFPQGTYLTAISYERNGSHTLTTNPTEVTVNQDGRLLEFKLLLEADRTMVTGQGLWVSAPVPIGQTPDVATLRLQAVAPTTGRSYVVRGPYNYNGRLAPTRNETMIGRAPPMARTTDYALVGGQVQSLLPGGYVFYIVQTTPAGESLPSAASPSGGTLDHRSPVKHSGYVFHPTLLPQANGYRIFHRNFFESSNPPFYELVRTRSADQSRSFTPDERPVLYGKIDSGDVTGQIPGTYVGSKIDFAGAASTDVIVPANVAGFNEGAEVRLNGGNLPPPLRSDTSYWIVNKSGASFKLAARKGGNAINLQRDGGGRIFTYKVIAPPATYQYISVSGDPPDEDTSGVADPQGDADVPLVVGMGIPPAGTYIVGYTRVLGGQETPLSRTVKITLTTADVLAGKVIKMSYPPRVNKIPNALYGQVDNKNLPIDWQIIDSTGTIITALGGNYTFSSAGVLQIAMSSSVADANTYPAARTLPGTDIALDLSRIETLAGWLEVSNRISGTGYIEVVQLDNDGVETGAHLTLATLTVNGGVYFEKTVGATGSGADLEFVNTSTFARIRWGATGNPRQLTVRAHSLIWAPQRGVSRRYYQPASPTEFWQATTNPAAPWPSTHVVAVGQPPPTAASLVSGPTTSVGLQPDMLDYITFENNVLPTGYAITRNPVDATTEASIQTVAAIEGTRGFRSRLTVQTYAPKGYAAKTYPVTTHGPNLSARFLLRLTALPLAGYVSVGGIKGEQFYDLPGFYIFAIGDIWGFYSHGAGTYGETKLMSGLKNGDVLDLEVIVRGLGTSNGSAEWWIGVNGAPRTQRWIRTSRNFLHSDYVRPRVWFGNWRDTGTPNTYTLDYDTVAVTKSSYQGQVQITNPSPALTPLVQPDWPWLSGNTLSGPTGAPVDYNPASANVSQRAIAGTFVRNSTLAAERTLLSLRTPANVEAVGIYMRVDSGVEMRRGATIFQVASPVPTATSYRFDLSVTGAGTADATALVYRTIGTGKRELIVLARNLDLTSLPVDRATSPDNAEITESNIVVTDSGEYVYDNAGPDGAPINQGYVSLVPADVTTGDIGFAIDEYIVQPGVQRTFAVFMNPSGINGGADLFTLTAYNEAGEPLELGSVYADGTAVANASPGWSEYWMTYTTPEGYFRIRVQPRNHTTGRYAFQKPLDAVGNLNTVQLRAAARDDRRAVTATYTAVLNARVPQTVGTMVHSAYGEERTGLGYHVELPTGTQKLFTVAAATDVFTLNNHRYVNGSAVRVLGLTGAAPLAIDTTYWVRDVTANTFKLAATNGGAAINITSDGSGTVYGYTFVTARYYSTDNPEVVGAWQAEGNESAVPDLEWVYAELTLSGDGTQTPRIPVGSPFVIYKTRIPVLLRGDRTPLPGGVYIGGGGYANNLGRPFRRSLFDEEAVGDRALARAITGEIGRLWGHNYSIFQPDALDEIQSDAFLEDDWVIESPFMDMVMRIRHYGVPSEPAAMFEYEGFDERSPFTLSHMMPLVVSIERAEVLALAMMSTANDSNLEGF